MDLVKELFEGSRLALARSITAVENEYENAIDIMKAIYPKTGNARILGITGAPGAGKSTLMKCMCNLINIDAGSINICGYDLVKDRKNALKKQASLIEGPGLFLTMTGLQNIKLFASLHDVSKQRLQEMIDYSRLGKHINKKCQHIH